MFSVRVLFVIIEYVFGKKKKEKKKKKKKFYLLSEANDNFANSTV